VTRFHVWRPSGPIAWRRWDGQFVVFHEPSGDTHQLSDLGGRVLLALAANPSGLDADEVFRHIVSDAAFVTHAEVQDVLEVLAERGLARRESS
jgi:PqqD family protein of HPr-rel-A system